MIMGCRQRYGADASVDEQLSIAQRINVVVVAVDRRGIARRPAFTTVRHRIVGAAVDSSGVDLS